MRQYGTICLRFDLNDSPFERHDKINRAIEQHFSHVQKDAVTNSYIVYIVQFCHDVCNRAYDTLKDVNIRFDWNANMGQVAEIKNKLSMLGLYSITICCQITNVLKI